ncbi:MAG TPA: hypothetical protein VLJ19_21720 [Variovorax sp.]|nr:hypothetical protein [Variovorax sp.]
MKKLIISAALASASLIAQAGIVGATLEAHAIGDYMAFCPDGWKGSATEDKQRVTCRLSLLPSLENAVIQITANKVSDIAFYLPDRWTFDAALADLNLLYGRATINPNSNGVFWRPGGSLIEAEMFGQRYRVTVKRGQ